VSDPHREFDRGVEDPRQFRSGWVIDPPIIIVLDREQWPYARELEHSLDAATGAANDHASMYRASATLGADQETHPRSVEEDDPAQVERDLGKIGPCPFEREMRDCRRGVIEFAG